MADLMDTIADIIKVEIDQGIEDSLPELDPVVAQAIPTATGVYKSGLGHDWKVKHTFSGSMSGSHGWRSPLGGSPDLSGAFGTTATPATNFGIYGTDSVQTWQNMNQISNTGFIQKELQLKEGYGNFNIPLQLLRADKLDASVGSAVAEIIKGAAMREALSEVHAFWKEAPTGATLSQNIGGFTAAGEVVDATGLSHEFTLTTGRIRSFFPGLAIRLWESDGTTAANANGTENVEPTWVASVDYTRKTIRLKTRADSVSTTLNSAAYFITPFSAESSVAANAVVSPSGLADWVRTSSGTVGAANRVFGIDLEVYPQFQSLVNTGESGALSSDLLNKYIGGFVDAYGSQLDTIVMTAGTMLGFLENIDSTSQLVRYDVQGTALNVKAGFQGMGYMYDGKVYRIMTSPNCPTGVVYVLKLGGQNLRKYVPPRLDRAGTQSEFRSRCEFLGPVLGYSNIFIPVRSSDAVTDFLQAPYYNWCEYSPRDVKSIKMGTFDENIFVAS